MTRLVTILIKHFGAGLVLVSLLGNLAFATPDVKVTVEPSFGTATDVFTIEVVVSGSSVGNISEPRFAQSDLFDLTGIGTSTRRQIINGKESSKITFSFQVFSKNELAPGEYQLPEGSVEIDGNTTPLASKKIAILKATAAEKKDPRSSGREIELKQFIDNTNPYVGEQICYSVEISTSDNFLGGDLGRIDPPGFWRESFGKQEKIARNAGLRTVTTFREGLIPTKSGELEIPERSLVARIRGKKRRRNSRLSDSFWGERLLSNFSRMDYEEYRREYSVKPLAISVRPLPLHPFSGSSPSTDYVPVGALRVRTTLSETDITSDQSTTLAVSISGNANLRPYELAEPTSGKENDFKYYFDKPTLSTGVQGNKIFYTKTFKIALVPKKDGTLSVPRFTIVWFDPKKEEYQTFVTPAATLNVKAGSENKNLQLSLSPEKADSQSQAPQTEKKEIAILGEDLQPQHIGPEVVYSTERKLSNGLFWCLFVFMSLLAIAGRIFLERRALALRDPELILQRNALQKALNTLDGSIIDGETSTAEPCKAILQTYIGEKLRCNAASLTAKELSLLVEKHSTNKQLSEKVKSHSARIEGELYQGDSSAQQDNSSLLAETRELISNLEQGLKKIK